jgi:hypothetical protein
MIGQPHAYKLVEGSQFKECAWCKLKMWAYGPLDGGACPKGPPESAATLLDRAIARGFGFAGVDGKFQGDER